MKKVLLFALACVGVGLFSGCATNETVEVRHHRGKGEPVIDAETGMNPAEIKAENTLINMLAAIQKLDYSEFSKDFSDELKKKITGDKFTDVFGKMNDHFGKVIRKTYLGALRKGTITIYMWKANFSNLPKDNEIFIRLIMEGNSAESKIFGFDVGLM